MLEERLDQACGRLRRDLLEQRAAGLKLRQLRLELGGTLGLRLDLELQSRVPSLQTRASSRRFLDDAIGQPARLEKRRFGRVSQLVRGSFSLRSAAIRESGLRGLGTVPTQLRAHRPAERAP